MLKVFYTLPNGKSYAHVSRSCTTTISAHVLKQFYPKRYDDFLKSDRASAQSFLDENISSRLPPGCVCMVRNPEDRLKSMLSRNSDPGEMVEKILQMTTSTTVTNREESYYRNLRVLRIVHLAPISAISESDSKFILWPNVEEACAELGLEYDPEIFCNKLRPDALERYERMLLPEDWKHMLSDSTALWKKVKGD